MTEKDEKTRDQRAENLAPLIDLGASLIEALPLAGPLVGAGKAARDFFDYRYGQKLQKFVAGTGLSAKEVHQILSDLQTQKGSAEIGEKLAETLGQLTDDTRAEYLGNLVYAVHHKKLSQEQFHRCVHALTMCSDLDLKKFFYDPLPAADESREQYAFLTAGGLVVNNGGFDGGILQPTNLGIAMHKAISETRDELGMPKL